MKGPDITLPAVLVVLALLLVGLATGYASAGNGEQAVESARPGPAPVGDETRSPTIALPSVAVPPALRPRVKPRPQPTTTTTAPVQTVPAPEQPAPTPSRGGQFDSVG